jgi:rhodanese-related sulfurtransferase
MAVSWKWAGFSAVVPVQYLVSLTAALVAGCVPSPQHQSSTVYVTEYGLGPDKWATAWLLTRRADRNSRLQIVQPGETRATGVVFDMPAAAIRRIGSRSAFEVTKEQFKLSDPTLDRLAEIVHEIEVNFWAMNGPAEARIVEQAFRSLQFRYGRDAVTSQCYLAFFERVYQVLQDAEANETLVSAERLQFDCEELQHLANRRPELVPEVPLVDVLTAAAAGRKVVFVDVREPDEYTEAHIPGALNIQLRNVSPSLREQLAGANYIVSYCVKDFRGFEMAKTLAQLGVENSVIMRPYGIKGWIALGLPVTGGNALSEEQAMKALQKCYQDTGLCLTPAASTT